MFGFKIKINRVYRKRWPSEKRMLYLRLGVRCFMIAVPDPTRNSCKMCFGKTTYKMFKANFYYVEFNNTTNAYKKWTFYIHI